MGATTPLSGGRVEDDVWLAALVDVPVLITATSRAEREACARAIHNASHRMKGPFVLVSAGSLDASAAPSGADASCTHWIEQARGGTLFVDDIEDLGTCGQAQLLRLLEERRMGLFRIIAGADPHLESRRASGAFSESLFYRLNVIRVDLTLP